MRNTVYLYLGRRGGINELTLAISKHEKESLFIISQFNEKKDEYLNKVMIKTFRSKLTFILNSFFILPQVILKISRYLKEISFGTDLNLIFTGFHPWNLILIIFLKKRYQISIYIHDFKTHLGERNIITEFIQNIFIKDPKIKIIVLGSVTYEQIKNVANGELLLKPLNDFFNINNRALSRLKLDETVNLFFFGRIKKYKGFEKISDIYKYLIKECNNCIFNIIVRGDGENQFKRHLNLMAKKFPIDCRFGWVDDVEISKIITGNTIVVLPYDEATQSGIIPLVIELGGYLVVTPVGSLPEQIKNYSNASLADSIMPFDIAIAIKKLVIFSLERAKYSSI